MADVDPNKTVFISYRREPSLYLAHSIFNELTRRGYDVFWDIQSIGSGRFAEIILKNIAARAHFIVLLRGNTLERCVERNDWLKREIEYAMQLDRAIIPILVDGFNFKSVEHLLIGKLEELPDYNYMPFTVDYFEAGIERLCNQFLSTRECGLIIPMSVTEQGKTTLLIKEANKATEPTKEELTAEQFFARGLVRQDFGDLDGAIAEYTEAIRLNPKYIQAYGNRGNAKRDKSDLLGSITDYEAVLSLDNHDALAYNNRGVSRFRLGDFEGALQDYTEAIKIDVDFSIAYSNRANIHDRQGNFPAAIEDYTKAIKLDDQFAIAYAGRGIARGEINDLEGAIEDFTRSIEIDPKSAEVYGNRAVALRRLGNIESAITDCTKAIQLNPNYPDAYSNRGNARLDKKDMDGAIADYTKAIQLNPTYVIAYHNRATARQQKGDFNGAFSDYTSIIELDPNNAFAYNNRGVIYNRVTDNIANYTKAIDIDNDFIEAYINRAEGYFLLREFDKSLIDLQHANELRAEYPMTIGLLCMTHHALGNTEEAKRLWQGLVEQDERFKDAEWVQQELEWAEPLVEEARKVIALL